MIKVTATANGYYGLKLRVPGEVFGIEAIEDFSFRWMESDDKQVVALARKTADSDKAAADWLKRRATTDRPAPQTRRVNTGGTDGVVGVEVPKPGTELTAEAKIAKANEISGRTDVTGSEADTILAAANLGGGSDNDDRTRDLASNPANNAPEPAADNEHVEEGAEQFPAEKPAPATKPAHAKAKKT